MSIEIALISRYATAILHINYTDVLEINSSNGPTIYLSNGTITGPEVKRHIYSLVVR